MVRHLPPGEPDRNLVPQPVASASERYPGATPYFETSDFSGAEPATLLAYWHMLSRHKGTLIVIAFLGALAGFVFTVPQAPTYQAHATLEVQGINENFLDMRDLTPTVSGASTYFPEYDMQTQAKILQSRSLIERVADKLGVENRPWLMGEARLAAWRKVLGLRPADTPSPRERFISTAGMNLKVRAQANTRLLEVLFDSPDPRFAADFINTLAAEFIAQNLEARWQTAQNTGEWLSRQMQDLKVKLEKSEAQLHAYARSAGLLFTAEKDNVAEHKLKQLQEELTKAQADRVVKQSRYELASSASPESLPEVLDNATLRDYQVKLTDLERQMAELSSALTPAHPKVVKLQAEIATLESALERERSNIIRRIRNEYQAAQRRENLLALDYAAQARLMSGQAAKITHYDILKREVDTTRQLYESMLQRVKEAGLASALRASNIRVVDAARPPWRPYKPSYQLNAAFGLLSGMLLGVVFVIMRERSDRNIQEPGDTSVYVNVPELGVILSGKSDSSFARRLLNDGRRGLKSLRAVSPHEQTGAGHRCELIARDGKPSPLTESFRAVLTSILLSDETGHRHRVLILSSANPGEGKTTIASNLAIALAGIKQRVLLIDGDLRRPRLHEIFGVENDAGLADLLRQPPGQPLRAVARETEIPNLYLLSSGRTSDTNLLYSEQLPELVRLARNEFDTVLIDTPPVLQMPDARVLARHADAVILVVRARWTSRDAALLARQRFSEDGTTLLGTILNDWDPRHTRAHGYHKYYDHYRHYYGREG